MRTSALIAIRSWIVACGLGLLAMPAMAQVYDKNQRLIMPERPTSNYSFLEGCWQTDPFRHAPSKPLGKSTYCFDGTGRGTLVFESEPYTCRQPATASYQGSTLRFVDTDGSCSNGVGWFADRLDCVRRSDGLASCSGVSGVDMRWTTTMRRIGSAPNEGRGTPEAKSEPEPEAPRAPAKRLQDLFERR